MEIVDEHAGFLTNYEVWRLVSSDRSERMHKKDPDSNLHNLRMIQSQVIRYLEGRDFKLQSEAFIQKCFSVLKAEPYCLAAEEVFSIINVMPRSVAEMHLLISDCSERLTDEQVEEVLQLVSLGSDEPGGEAADAMDEERSGE